MTVGTATNATNVSGTVAIANGGTGLTSAGTSGYVLASNGSGLTYKKLGLGITGETWHDLTGTNVTGTTYTNNNAYPIMVCTNQAGSSQSCNAYVNGVKVQTSYCGGSANATMTWIVPPGATYATDGASASNWNELY
jgi:hypothetical protein